MIKLKRVYDKKESVPEAQLGLYKENGEGKWVLDLEIDGLTPTKRVDDFRETNLKLVGRLKEYGDSEYGEGDMTPARVTELVTKEKDFVAGNTKNKEEVEKLVDQRTEEMRKTHDREKKALNDKNAELTGKLQKISIESKAIEAAIPLGLKKTAADDLVMRVLKVFKMDENGNPVAYEADGRTARFGSSGERLTIEEFVKNGATDKEQGFAHLFADSGGAGGDPTKRGSRDGGGGDDGGYNPWINDASKGIIPNRTEQNKIIKSDPDLAERMAKRAGVDLKIGEATRAGVKAGM